MRRWLTWCARQQQLGIDIPGHGEFGKSMGHRVNYGAWWHYSFQRLGGLDPARAGRSTTCTARRSRPGEVVLTQLSRTGATGKRFAAAYADPEFGIHLRAAHAALAGLHRPDQLYRPGRYRAPTSPTSRPGSPRSGIEEGFMTAIAPGSASRIANAYYKTDVEFLFAWPRRCARNTRHHRCRPDPAARRSGDRRDLRHDQCRADVRGVPPVHRAAHRSAE